MAADERISGDDLASEIERFLRETGREGGSEDAGPFEGR